MIRGLYLVLDLLDFLEPSTQVCSQKESDVGSSGFLLRSSLSFVENVASSYHHAEE